MEEIRQQENSIYIPLESPQQTPQNSTDSEEFAFLPIQVLAQAVPCGENRDSDHFLTGLSGRLCIKRSLSLFFRNHLMKKVKVTMQLLKEKIHVKF
jgi:hypothetical protein